MISDEELKEIVHQLEPILGLRPGSSGTGSSMQEHRKERKPSAER